jgi:hypothetical protein
MWTLLMTAAFAGTPAYYHPDDIAARSARFKEVAEVIQPKFERGQDVVARLSGALADLEIAVGLLGTDAPEGLTSWSQLTRRQVTGQYLRLNKHAELVQEDFSKVFLDALGRALPRVGAGKDLVECQAKGVEAMMHHTSCVGEDLNGPLAAAIDSDGQLGRELASILSIDWPTIAVDPQPQVVVPLTGTTRWVDLAALGHTFLQARLDARKDVFEHDLAPFEDALDAKDPAAIARAGEMKATYLARLGADGAVLRAAAAEALGRSRKAPREVGLCANPAALGGRHRGRPCGAQGGQEVHEGGRWRGRAAVGPTTVSRSASPARSPSPRR